LFNDEEIYLEDYDSFVLTPSDEVHFFPSTTANAPDSKDVRLSKSIGDDFEGLFPELDKDMINYIHSKLFDPNYDQNKPRKVLDQIIYRSDLILEARAILKSTKYNGLEIIVGENMNPAVIALLQDKFNKGEEWSKLERIIVDVASFYLSGGSNIATFRIPQIKQKDLNLAPIYPSSKRVVSQNYQVNSKNTQQFLTSVWKDQRLGNNYVFGMVYKWINRITGKSYIGRTQRTKGSPYYRPYSSMSVRFEEEIEKAFKSDPKDLAKSKNQFYYDLRMIYDNPRPGQTGMDAIRESMELEIVEIQLLGENFDADTYIIKTLEDLWIEEFRRQGESLYNIAGGTAGSTALLETTGYGKRDVHRKVRYLFSHGSNGIEIGNYLGISKRTMSGIFEAATGMDARSARLYYSGQRMFELMDDGIFDLDELATHFRSMNTNDVFVSLATKNFPLGNEYLKGWFTARCLRIFGSDFISDFHQRGLIYDNLKDMGVTADPATGIFYEFRKRTSLWEHYQRGDFGPLLRFYAKMIIKDYDTIYGFLHHLGLIPKEIYFPSSDFFPQSLPWELDQIVTDLLGYDFDTAKDIYSDRYFGHLQIIIGN